MTPREKAIKIKNFIHYTDSSGDFWCLEYKKSPERNDLATLLKAARNTRLQYSLNIPFYFMEYYLNHYFVTWDHKWHYNDEALELMNELYRAS